MDIIKEMAMHSNGYICYARAARCCSIPRASRDAGRAYIVERLHLAIGRTDMSLFSVV